MQPQYFIGVDGGGTRCRVKLTDQVGNQLAQCIGGPANVYSNFEQTMQTVMQLIDQALSEAKLPLTAVEQTSVVLGLAGANVQSARRKAQAYPQPFQNYRVYTDVEIACIGAHLAQPGGVLIIGTGSQGAYWDTQQFHCVGGWGMTISDQGSGAQLGLNAVRLALQAQQNLLSQTLFTQQIMAKFSYSPEQLLKWSHQATPADWGQFAPIVFAHADNDHHACTLIRQTAQEISVMLEYLTCKHDIPVALMGGLAEPILRWLPIALQAKVVPPQTDALSGACLLARSPIVGTRRASQIGQISTY
ncbi:glucosamine kinase nucleotide-binding domain-containing protein [Celerinatantimonas diazotrophica]|uniref:Glucosamine kinase n=1 Tax=Celerinatantimonas diazotrophica TaxID=412034 RepID=A0A4R1K191_9GAMM|nr:BadF/BadG/BcrA/BcrD ATPase family protein [Celerinatantimonas diazotrophica]TCK57725.1 glucosamine kinase [Celerinatantimonas diazotrophica]CAG9298213.1 Glucosamine kinase GspK [Celerinatantimonas diazotrophica]